MKERIAIFIDTKENSGGAYEESLYLIENIEKFNKINFIQIPEKKRITLADFIVTTSVKKSTTYKQIDKILNKVNKKNNTTK